MKEASFGYRDLLSKITGGKDMGLHSRSVSTDLDFSTVASGAIEKKILPVVNRKIIWHRDLRFEVKEQKGQTRDLF